MMDRAKSSNDGFTLIELMIVLSVMTVLVAPFIFLEVKFAEKIHDGINRRDMAESGSTVMDWISRDIRDAIDLPDKWQGLPWAEDRLIVRMSGGDVAVYSFEKNDNTLTRRLFPKGDEKADPEVTQLARNVNSFRVVPSGDEGKSLMIEIKLARDLINRKAEITMSGTASRRIR